VTFDELLNNIKAGDYTVLQIEDEHLKRLSGLPFIHKDPFDRLLIASALAENLTIITANESSASTTCFGCGSIQLTLE
jgi:PIN domain nuclease of toxin-antitoxin system